MRRWTMRIVIGLAALVLIDTTLWFGAVAQMRSAWTNTLDQARKDGWQIAAGAAVAEGWPLAARLRVAGLEMSRDDGKLLPGGIGYGAQSLLLELPFRPPLRLAIRPLGQQHLRVGLMPDAALNAGDLVLRSALDGEFATLTGENLIWSIAPAPLALGHLQADLHHNPAAHPAQGDLVATLDGLDVSLMAQRFGLDGVIGHAGFDIGLQNGVVSLRDVSLSWGKLKLNGRAQMQADANSQPSGDGKLVITGADDVLADLLAAGKITQQNAATGKMVLGLLQRPGKDGRNVVELPLSVHERQLIVAQFPLARLPPMTLAPGIVP